MVTLHTIEYGGQTIGALGTPVGSFRYTVDTTAGSFLFEQDFIVEGGDQSTHESRVSTVLSSFPIRDGALSVSLPVAGEVIDRDPTTKTATRTFGVIVRAPQLGVDGAAARGFTLRVTGGILASEMFSGSGGFGGGTILLSQDATRRPIYVLRGRYTVTSDGGGQSARAAYDDATDGARKWFEDWLESNGGGSANYDIVAESSSEDEISGAVDQFQITARWRLVTPVEAGNTDRWIVESMTVRVIEEAGFGIKSDVADTGGDPVRFMVTAVINPLYTYVTETNAESLYRSTVRGWFFNRLNAIASSAAQPAGTGGGGAGELALLLLSEQHSYDAATNAFSVDWVLTRTSQSGLLAWNHTLQVTDDKQTRFGKLADGDEFSYDVQEPYPVRIIEQSITATVHRRGQMTEQSALSIAPSLPSQWHVYRRAVSWAPRSAVLAPTGASIVWDVQILRIARQVSGSSGGGSFGGVVTPGANG